MTAEVCANLEEAMSSISLSEPERSFLRYVHVWGLHHPLIDPAKTNSALVILVTGVFTNLEEKKNIFPCTEGLALLNPSVTSYPEVGIDSRMLSTMHMV